MSTPIKVTEGGSVWGVMLGYEFTPYFALEASYMDYPEAEIAFDKMSLFSFNHDGIKKFTTETETLNLMGKIMLVLPNTYTRVYSSFGVANLHRNDMLVQNWLLTPTFGVGLNFHLTEHIMSELSGNYTAGFGESQLSPADSYYPFLYALSFRLAYCY